jgi:hypothetical protein
MALACRGCSAACNRDTLLLLDGVEVGQVWATVDIDSVIGGCG